MIDILHDAMYLRKNGSVPVDSYHVPFFGYPILVLGLYNHKVGYPKKGMV